MVKRDSEGNFSANIISATLDGNSTGFTGMLSGDVSGTQSSTVVSFLGGINASIISNHINDATAINTPSTLVKRDPEGNISVSLISCTSLKVSTDDASEGKVLTCNDTDGNVSWRHSSIMLLGSVTLDSPQTHIEFENLNQTYTTLLIKMIGRTDEESDTSSIQMTINGGESSSIIGNFVASNGTPGNASTMSLELIGYNGSVFNKTWIDTFSGNSGHFDSTNPITSLRFSPVTENVNFVVGVFVQIYGLL